MDDGKATAPDIDIAVDNDLVLKAACYDLAANFWPSARVAVLGAARYVVPKAIERGRARDAAAALKALEQLLAESTALEPSDREVALAAEIEVVAQREHLSIDTGESQLGAIVIERAIAVLETGDKRAIRGLEQVLPHVAEACALAGKVRCFEQIVLRALNHVAFEEAAHAVCAEPDVDKAMSICFSCYSDATATEASTRQGLESYISALRQDAPRVLAA